MVKTAVNPVIHGTGHARITNTETCTWEGSDVPCTYMIKNLSPKNNLEVSISGAPDSLKFFNGQKVNGYHKVPPNKGERSILKGQGTIGASITITIVNVSTGEAPAEINVDKNQ